MTDDEQPRVSRIEFKDAPDHSGLVIRTDGRVCIVNDGSGFSLQLDAARLREMGVRCLVVSTLLAAREAAAADEAGADLERIMVAGNG